MSCLFKKLDNPTAAQWKAAEDFVSANGKWELRDTLICGETHTHVVVETKDGRRAVGYTLVDAVANLVKL